MSDERGETPRPGIALARHLSDPPPDDRRRELEELSDEALAVRHLEEDGHAFQVLVDRYRGPLVNWLTKRLGSRAEAEDLAQRTFMRVFQHLHRFDPERRFSTWIYTIAGNLAKNVYRNRSRDPLVLFQTLTGDEDRRDRPLQWADESYLPDEMAERRDLQKIVDETVDELPDHYRTVFEMRELRGRSYEEIAESTGLKLGTVKSRLSRARSRFADLISSRIEEPEAAARGEASPRSAAQGREDR